MLGTSIVIAFGTLAAVSSVVLARSLLSPRADYNSQDGRGPLSDDDAPAHRAAPQEEQDEERETPARALFLQLRVELGEMRRKYDALQHDSLRRDVELQRSLLALQEELDKLRPTAAETPETTAQIISLVAANGEHR